MIALLFIYITINITHPIVLNLLLIMASIEFFIEFALIIAFFVEKIIRKSNNQ
jgi:hypothetical protein